MGTRNEPHPGLKSCILLIVLMPLAAFELSEPPYVCSQAMRPTQQPSQTGRAPEAARKAKAQAKRPSIRGEDPSQQRDSGDSSNRIGQIRVDIPDSVEVGTPFNIDIGIDFRDPNYLGSVKVVMEQSGSNVVYEPRMFEVKPHEEQTVQVTIVRAPSGLGVISARAEGFNRLVEPVNASFRLKLKHNLDHALTSGQVSNASFDFVNGKGDRVPLDAPIALLLKSANLQFRLDPAHEWTDQIEVEIQQNESSSPPIQIKPRWLWSATNGYLETTVSIIYQNQTRKSVFNENISLNVVPRWWLPLMVATLGGIVFSLYRATQDWVKTTHSRARKIPRILITRILPGALAGALAYFLVNLNLLGIKIDTTAWQGFLVLGFLFAYVGVDSILKFVTKKDSDSPKGAPKRAR